MAEPRLEPGALAALTADTPDDWHRHYRLGFMFTVEEFVPALRPGDKDYDNDDVIQGDFYYGNADGGLNNVCVPASIVRQVKSAAEMAARKIPTLREASKLVAGGLHDAFGDGPEIYESSISGPDNAPEVEAYGRTDEDLPFGMRVVVLEVWRADD